MPHPIKNINIGEIFEMSNFLIFLLCLELLTHKFSNTYAPPIQRLKNFLKIEGHVLLVILFGESEFHISKS
jgi:hypothetical protein